MKKLKISSLMNEYQDQESEPVPQPGLVDGERVRQRVLGQVAGRRRRKLRRAVIAAVAAAACLGLVAWTWGERIYQMASGGQVTIGEGYGSVTMSDGKGEEGEPLVVSLEAGRLWFVAGGERTDQFPAYFGRRRGINPAAAAPISMQEYRTQQLDLLADGVRHNLDLAAVYAAMGLAQPAERGNDQ